MDLLDLRERTGPYWEAYQARRARDQITHDPDFVPHWFVAELARKRVAAARTALERLTPPAHNGRHDELEKVWRALRVVEEFIHHGNILDGPEEQVVAGLLGAEEIEIERDRAAVTH